MTEKQAARRHRRFIATSVVVLIVSVTVLALSLSGIHGILAGNDAEGSVSSEQITSSGSASSGKPNSSKPKKVSSATVVNTGDILIHNPVLAGAKTSTGDYDFSGLFSPVADYFKKADFAVANLELSLGGTESGAYNGYPAFNTPDSVVDALTSAGIDMLLTANNHCYDTGLFGLQRTVQVLKQKKVAYTGTRELDTEPKYLIQDVNGIKIGIMCYTYCTSPAEGRIAINGATVKSEANSLINTFSYDNLDAFYTEAEAMLSLIEQKGADCTVFYMHWGDEYRLTANEYQKSMAQRLCNMGVDVIVGSHPHVIEPIDLLQSEGGDHQTVCLYSIGNGVSNQRREELNNNGHTEDGMLFYYTFDKYSDGTTALSSVDIIPTWVEKTGARYNAKYKVYAIESEDFAEKHYSLSQTNAALTKESYNRTKAIVKEGLDRCQKELGCKQRFGE